LEISPLWIGSKKGEYEDKRNWKEYNEELVMRGYFYFNPEFLNKWNEEIKQMKDKLRGEWILGAISILENR
jgi:hypothetical protein